MEFGRLTVIKQAPDTIRANGYPRHYFECKCKCGTVKVIESYKLTSGHTVSCGCARFKDIDKLDGVKPTKYHMHYGRGRGIINRCTNPNSKDYHNYGGRGIKCELGDTNIGVATKLEEVPGYFEGAEIDRIDVNGNYTLFHPKYKEERYSFFDKEFGRECSARGNLRWVTHSENAKNRRDSVHITQLEGIPMSLVKGKRLVERLGYKKSDFTITKVKNRTNVEEYIFKLKR